MKNVRRPIVLPVLTALVVALGTSAAPAWASQTLGFTATFGAAPANPYPLSEPVGVAVNEVTSGDVGDVYVVDKGNSRVEQFSATGTFILMFGKKVNKTKVEAAAPEAEQNVCTVASGNTCQAGTEGPGAGELRFPEWIAVDNSGNGGDPSNGDVYVTNTAGGNTISKFTANGAYLGELTETEGVSFRSLDGVAVNPSGDVWVFQHTPEIKIDEFSDALANAYLPPSIESSREAEPGFAVDSGGNFYVDTGAGPTAKLNGSGVQLIHEMDGHKSSGVAVNLDPSSSELDNVYVVDNMNSVAEFNTVPNCTVVTPCGEGSPPTDIASFGSPLMLKNGRGIAVDGATGVVYVADAGKNDVDISGFGSPPSAPITEAGSGITHESATLNGTLTSGSQRVNYSFIYNLGNSCTGGQTSPEGEAESNGKQSTMVSGLQPNSVYTFCMVTTTEFGSTQGAPEHLTTEGLAPGIGIEEKSEVTYDSATLEAEISPNNEPTTYEFEYALSEGELAVTPTTIKGTGTLNGLNPVPGSVRTGAVLRPNTEYFYRVIAENQRSQELSTPSEGPIQHFTTSLGPPLVLTGTPPSAFAGSANVQGMVNPESSPATYVFQYGTTTSYGYATQAVSAGSGNSDVAAPSALGDLAPDTLYHYRIVATNDSGTTYGEDETFTTGAPTPPLVSTGAAGAVSINAASISAIIETGGLPAIYGFEIGTEAGAYGVATGLGSVGAGLTETVTLALQNLQPGTTYHYRIEAANVDGVAYGADRSFTTPGFPALLTLPVTAPLIVIPSIAFPTETVTPPVLIRKLTNAQKLTNALKACKRDKAKAKRKFCERTAHRRYASKPKPEAKK